MKVAKGEWVIFVDSDDYYTTDKVYEEIFSHDLSAIDFVRFRYRDDLGNGEYNIELPLDNIKKNESVILNRSESIAKFNIFNSTWMVMVRPSIINGLRFEFIKPHEDRLWIKTLLFRINSSLIINQDFYFYRQNQNSITRRYMPSYVNDSLYYIKRLKSLFEEYNIKYDSATFNQYTLDFFNRSISQLKKSELHKIKDLYTELEIKNIITIKKIFEGNKFWTMRFLLKIRGFKILNFCLKRGYIANQFPEE